MLVYSFVLFLIILGICIRFFEERMNLIYKSDYIYFTIFVVLTFISAFRYNVGMDYYSYVEIYNNNSNVNEKGFSCIVSFLHILSHDPLLFFVLSSLIINFLFYKFILQFALDKWVSLLVYFSLGQLYFASFNGIRQFIAVSIFLYSLKYLVNNSFVKYFFLVFVASYCCHSSALILLPLYFFIKRDNSIYVYILGFVAMALILFILEQLVVRSNYAIYLLFDQFKITSSTIYYFYIFIDIVYMFLKIKVKHANVKNVVIFNLVYLHLIFCLSVILLNKSPLAIILIRLNYYFFPVYMIIFSDFVLSFKVKNLNNCFRFIVVTSLSFYSIVSLVNSGHSYNLLPYSFVFLK